MVSPYRAPDQPARCSRCGKTKSPKQFHLSEHGTLASWCKECHREDNRLSHKRLVMPLDESFPRLEWTDKDYKTLQKMWRYSTDEEIGIALGRSANAVMKRRILLGLRRGVTRNPEGYNGTTGPKPVEE